MPRKKGGETKTKAVLRGVKVFCGNHGEIRRKKEDNDDAEGDRMQGQEEKVYSGREVESEKNKIQEKRTRRRQADHRSSEFWRSHGANTRSGRR